MRLRSATSNRNRWNPNFGRAGSVFENDVGRQMLWSRVTATLPAIDGEYEVIVVNDNGTTTRRIERGVS